MNTSVYPVETTKPNPSFPMTLDLLSDLSDLYSANFAVKSFLLSSPRFDDASINDSSSQQCAELA